MIEIRPLLLAGPRQAGELAEALGVTRAGLLHAYRRETDRVLRFGRARSTRYAARESLAGLNSDEFPVFRVDETGQIRPAGELITLANHQSIWLPHDSVVDGLPWELHDIAPRGFLGRSFAVRHSELALPDDVTHWSDHHVLLALSRRGEDLPGNLVVGRESFDRFQRLAFEECTPANFSALAAMAFAGRHAGSSAGGERPKFTCFSAGRHCIVKFASNDTDNARRWQDLLALEHTALETLRSAGVPTAGTALVDVNDLRCLIVERFDRIGPRGRRAVMTIAAATERMDGSWTDGAEALLKREQLSREDLRRIALLDAYGALIANADRHRHNLLLFPERGGYTLAPAFDQLPMAYAPTSAGYIRNVAVEEAVPMVNTLEVWDEALQLAMKFWRSAAEQPVSESMRDIVQAHSRRYGR